MRSVGLFLFVVFAVSFASPQEVFAQSWVSGANITGNLSVSQMPASACPSVTFKVTIRDVSDEQTICYFGDEQFGIGTYMARTGREQAVLRFGLDTEYRPLLQACGLGGPCLYSPEEDIFIQNESIAADRYGIAIYRNARESIRHVHGGFELPLVPDYVFGAAEGLSMRNFALSNNGRWLVAEIRNEGIALVDTRTMEWHRVIGGGYLYGVGNDPELDMAVTNDGKFVAVGGQNARFTITDVSNGCGGWTAIPVPCLPTGVNINELTVGSYLTKSLRFNDRGNQIGFYFQSQATRNRFLTLRTSDYQFDQIPYLATGDSFVSGEGELDDAYYKSEIESERSRCHVSTRSYPYLLARFVEVVAENIACSGAKIITVLNQRLYIEGHQPKVLTVGVGGNDVGFMTKLKACLMPGECEWVRSEHRALIREEIRALRSRLASLYSQLRYLVNQTKLYAVSYPRIIDLVDDCEAPLGSLLSKDERQFIDESIKYTNYIIRMAALNAGIGYLDLEDSIIKNGLCANTPSAMNGFRFGDDIGVFGLKLLGNESFHPTPLGHAMIAQYISAKHPSLLEDMHDDAMPIPSDEYWGAEVVGRNLRQVDFAELRDASGDLEIFFPPQTFKPFSTVRFEIHSESEVLGTEGVSARGGLSAQISLPQNLPEGFHTLHVFGESYSEEEVDVYQLVSIAKRDTEVPVRSPTPQTSVLAATTPATQTGASSKVKGESIGSISKADSELLAWHGWIVLLSITLLLSGLLVALLLKLWRGT